MGILSGYDYADVGCSGLVTGSGYTLCINVRDLSSEAHRVDCHSGEFIFDSFKNRYDQRIRLWCRPISQNRLAVSIRPDNEYPAKGRKRENAVVLK